MPGYSAIIYSVPKFDFNTPDSNGNTACGNIFLSCFRTKVRTYFDFALKNSQLWDGMVDQFTSLDINYYKKLQINLFHPLSVN